MNRRDFVKLLILGVFMPKEFLSFNKRELCLTSDMVPPNSFDKIEMKIDHFKSFLIDPMVMSDGKQRLFYDVSQLPRGKHRIVVRGMKGRRFGESTDFEFRI